MRAYSSLSSIFLEIRKKEQFRILSLESITSGKTNHKPAKGSLSSSQLFVTSPHKHAHTHTHTHTHTLQPLFLKHPNVIVSHSPAISHYLLIHCKLYQIYSHWHHVALSKWQSIIKFNLLHKLKCLMLGTISVNG